MHSFYKPPSHTAIEMFFTTKNHACLHNIDQEPTKSDRKRLYVLFKWMMTRQIEMKKHSLQLVNEHFEFQFNAVSAASRAHTVVFKKKPCPGGGWTGLLD